MKVTGKRNKQRIIPLVNHFTIKLEEYIKIRNENFLIQEAMNGFLLPIKGTSCMINMFIIQ